MRSVEDIVLDETKPEGVVDFSQLLRQYGGITKKKAKEIRLAWKKQKASANRKQKQEQKYTRSDIDKAKRAATESRQ